jgi:hypothetical protein
MHGLRKLFLSKKLEADFLCISRDHLETMELDLQSLFMLHVHSCTRCTRWLRPRNPLPSAAFRLIDEGAIGQQR